MLDVAIVGGGVCGLALAHSLQARRMDWRLFEARERQGGRVLTETASKAAGGAALDLGPGWFWPRHQPSITRLVADLGLATLAQTDDGRVLHLSDPNRSPETVLVSAEQAPAADGSPTAVHGGAMRLAGGMAALVQALARPLPPQRLALGTVLQAVVDHGDFVELRLLQAGVPISVQARRVVLALPPRLAESRVRFEPALPEGLAIALRAVPTWMATAAKAAMAYPTAFWKDAGHTGNAWVTHPQAVLAEVFDASAPAGGGAALAGFLAQGAASRQSFEGGMDLLLRSQLGQLFGVQAEDGELHRTDWARDPLTCSPLDLQQDGQGRDGGHATSPDPQVLEALGGVWWSGRLMFGGSETARQGHGYLEGALSAAARLRRELQAGSPA